VIKASAMPAPDPPAAPKRPSGGSIPIVDPFSAAVAEGSAPTGRITPYLSPDEPRPDPLENSASEAPSMAEPPEVIDESEMTLVTPLELNEALRAAPLIIEEAVRASVPEAKSAPPTANPAIPPGSSAGSVPASAFDFLGGPSPGAAAPGGYEAFEFGLAAPAARGDSPPAPSSSGSKPIAARKPLLGLFGRKKLPAQSAKPDAAPAAVVPALPAGGEGTPSNSPATPPEAPQPAPPAADDPFAFLR
jgi:hypothetical protein